jgi:hypothetical protein
VKQSEPLKVVWEVVEGAKRKERGVMEATTGEMREVIFAVEHWPS